MDFLRRMTRAPISDHAGSDTPWIRTLILQLNLADARNTRVHGHGYEFNGYEFKKQKKQT